jgi:hypothetical protein
MRRTYNRPAWNHLHRANSVLFTILFTLGSFLALANPREALAGECGAEIIADLVGAENIAKLSATGQVGCNRGVTRVGGARTPYYTYDVACSTDKQAAGEGLCSATPCPDFGRFFAFRTIHRPDGSSASAGFSCVSLEQAAATPGITVAQVFEAVRRVRLPGGEIGVEPGVGGWRTSSLTFGWKG